MSKITNKIFLMVVFLFVFIGLSLTFSLNAQAINENIDVYCEQPVVIMEGEEFTINQIIGKMNNNGTKLNPSYVTAFNITYNGATKCSLSTNGLNGTCTISNVGISSTNKSVECKLSITYKMTSTGTAITKNVPVLIMYNNLPMVNVPHIYVSYKDYQTYKTITNNNDANSLYQYILKQVSIEDVDDTATNVELFGFSNSSSFNVGEFKPGTTNQICVVVEDLNKTVTIPCYVTVFDNEQVNSVSEGKVRSISKRFYPYYLDNIKKDENGYYYAKKVDGIYYFVDTSNQILKDKDGNTFPVDACLANAIGAKTGDLYQVIPRSKWITDGNCMALLTNCLTNPDTSDPAKYISSWKFDNNDIKTIQKMINDGNLDENFYYNYYSNGYCSLGLRKPNEMGRITDATPLGTNTGLKYYVSNDTLYIIANEVDNTSYTYKIPSYNIVGSVTGYDHRDNNGFDFTVFAASKNSWTNKRTTAPWAQYNFSKVILDDKIKEIGEFAFYGMTSITEPIKIPASCTKIGTGAFMNCVNMSGDIETRNVHKIEAYAFANCKNLKGKLQLGTDALQIIGDGAFMNCGFTSSLSVPASVSEIGNYTFMNCKDFSGRLNLSNNLQKLGKFAFAGCSKFDGDLTIPNSLQVVPEFAFANCYGFNGLLKLGNSVTQVGDYAFYGCYNASGDVILPETLTTIGVAAFKNCHNLKSQLVINNKLTKISAEAFAGCYNIITIDNRNQSQSLTVSPRAFYVSSGVVTKIIKPSFVEEGYTVTPSLFAYNYAGDNRVKSES